jgi:16S rRNA (cytidine1402-2'-O)-methyltransferase
MKNPSAKLYLLPTPISETDPEEALPKSALEAVAGLRHFICEHPRSARRHLKRFPLEAQLQDLTFYPLHKHSDPSEHPSYLSPIEKGCDVALLSDAGCPGVADPGAEIVALAHRKRIPVHPLIGPSSILQTLMASGLSGQRFRFHGYAPYDDKDLKKLIASMSRDASSGETQLIMETPYRNERLLKAFLDHGPSGLRLCIAVDLGNANGQVRTQLLSEWKEGNFDLHKRPAVFALGP